MKLWVPECKIHTHVLSVSAWLTNVLVYHLLFSLSLLPGHIVLCSVSLTHQVKMLMIDGSLIGDFIFKLRCLHNALSITVTVLAHILVLVLSEVLFVVPHW